MRAYLASAQKALAPTRKYAGIAVDSFRDPATRRLATIRGTKAHRTATGQDSASVAADIRGIAAADEAAGEAMKLHPAFGAEIDATTTYYTKRDPHVVAAVAAAMACFPPVPRWMARAPRPTTIAEAKRVKGHLWKWAAGTWRCEACGDSTREATMPSDRHRQTCAGSTIIDAAVRYAAKGRTLAKADADLPIIMRSRCGAWGNRRTRKPGTSSGASTPARGAGDHGTDERTAPALAVGPCGRPERRAVARVTAAYDAASGQWVSFDSPPEDQPAAERGQDDATINQWKLEPVASIKHQPCTEDGTCITPPCKLRGTERTRA